MMLTKEEFSRIEPLAGWVICEVTGMYTESGPMLAGMRDIIVSEQSKSDISVRSGVVWKASSHSDIEWRNEQFDSDVEVEPGAKVWWTMNAAAQVILDEKNSVYYVENKVYFRIPYKELVLRIKSGGYMGLNDYVITEPVADTTGVYAKVELYSGLAHRVVAVPSWTATYRDLGRVLKEEAVRCEVGDIVITRSPTINFIENKTQNDLPGRWCCFQSRVIVGKKHDAA